MREPLGCPGRPLCERPWDDDKGGGSVKGNLRGGNAELGDPSLSVTSELEELLPTWRGGDTCSCTRPNGLRGGGIDHGRRCGSKARLPANAMTCDGGGGGGGGGVNRRRRVPELASCNTRRGCSWPTTFRGGDTTPGNVARPLAPRPPVVLVTRVGEVLPPPWWGAPLRRRGFAGPRFTIVLNVRLEMGPDATKEHSRHSLDGCRLPNEPAPAR